MPMRRVRRFCSSAFASRICPDRGVGSAIPYYSSLNLLPLRLDVHLTLPPEEWTQFCRSHHTRKGEVAMTYFHPEEEFQFGVLEEYNDNHAGTRYLVEFPRRRELRLPLLRVL
jgi:hypothetical protein